MSPLKLREGRNVSAIRRVLRRLRRMVARSRSQLTTPPPPSPPGPSKRDIWSIAIYSGSSPFEIQPAVGASNPALTGADVSDIRGRYVADPFLVRTEAGWHMFFEVLKDENGRGEIGLARSTDGLRWRYEKIVLRESFHLSYPYVFQWPNQYYMVPETHEINEVRLYRADDFPRRWSLQSTLITGGKLVDSSPFYHQDRWWMLSGQGALPFRADTLRLFMADDLLGPWREHPCSPIVSRNGHIARPGGRVLVTEGKAFRFAQDCDPSYGKQVRAFEITELTPTTYREAPVGENPILQPGGWSWNAAGMHHVDHHRLADGQWRACVDGWFWEITA